MSLTPCMSHYRQTPCLSAPSADLYCISHACLQTFLVVPNVTYTDPNCTNLAAIPFADYTFLGVTQVKCIGPGGFHVCTSRHACLSLVHKLVAGNSPEFASDVLYLTSLQQPQQCVSSSEHPFLGFGQTHCMGHSMLDVVHQLDHDGINLLNDGCRALCHELCFWL